MKVLLVSDRQDGGIKRHVQCLRSCLPPEVEHYTIGEDEPFAGKSGHDIKEWWQIRRVVKTFKPDVIHLHTLPLWMCVYLKLFCKIPRVVSFHMPYRKTLGRKNRFLLWLSQPAYCLPVSAGTWARIRYHLPKAMGEVFYNPVLLFQRCIKGSIHRLPIIGMVGRNAAAKDWPSFHKVAAIVGVETWNIGEFEMIPNAREKIAQMTVYVLTSKTEEMPTVVLECFAEKTPICGFIPEGGMSEILSYSNGALKEVFIEERSCEKLAAIVKRLLADEELRKRVAEDGWQILTNHFDAEKNCRGQLMDVYRKVCRK